jgi:ADP-dependent NAD(P)H-hydrate dehydratase / NAD(P)H-hydrate epimerase
MKVVTAQQMANIEAKAFKEGASEEEFMEEAGSGVALVAHDFVEKNNLYHKVIPMWPV